MGYLFGVGGVLVFQSAFSFAIIQAGTGNGSFVGLGAMLLAGVGIPFTALANFLFIRAGRRHPEAPTVARVVLASLTLPAAQLALLVLVAVFRL